jgi:FtsZ-binding cell division protein ZapB
VVDSNGSILWANETENRFLPLPPNVDKLKEDFKLFRKQHLYQEENKQPSLSKNKGDSRPDRKQDSTKGSTNAKKEKISSFEGSQVPEKERTTEKNQTYEMSENELNLRQKLFESSEKRGLGSVSNERGSSNTDTNPRKSNGDEIRISDDGVLEWKPEADIEGMDYQIYQELIKEYQTIKERFNSLTQENQELHERTQQLESENRNVHHENQGLAALNKGGHPRKESVQEHAVKESSNFMPSSMQDLDQGLAKEVKDIKEIIEHLVSSQEASKVVRLPKAPPPPQPPVRLHTNPVHILPNFFSSGTDPLNARKDSHNHSLQLESNIAQTKKVGKGQSEASKSRGSARVSVSSSKQSSSKEKRLQDSLQAKYPSEDPMGLFIYEKWTDRIRFERETLRQIRDSLEGERQCLKKRKKLNQNYEYQTLRLLQGVNLSHAVNKSITSNIVQDIRRFIFSYELDAERFFQLNEIFQMRERQLAAVEESLRMARQNQKINRETERHMAYLFSSYLSSGQLYDAKWSATSTNILGSQATHQAASGLQRSREENLRHLFSSAGERQSKQWKDYSRGPVEYSDFDYIKKSLAGLKSQGKPEGPGWQAEEFFERQKAWLYSVKLEVTFE